MQKLKFEPASLFYLVATYLCSLLLTYLLEEFVMVFTPRMPKISYLKDENSKRELAGNAITIGEWTIFESKKFLTSI